MGILNLLFGKRTPRIEGRWLQGSGNFGAEVVGESHYQAALSAIAGGRVEGGHTLRCAAELVTEPHNRHDSNAVVVKIDGHVVGYLPREIAPALCALLNTATGRGLCQAEIVGGWDDGDGDVGAFGVRLDLLRAPPRWRDGN